MSSTTDAAMQLKDILAVGLSAAAFAFGISSFILSFRQRSIEGVHNNRKTLSDIVGDLINVNIAGNQLDLDYPNSTDRKVVEFRRTYNSQRRFLANHGEYIADKIPDLVTDIDCSILAQAFSRVGDSVRAEKFFKLSVEKAPNNVLKVSNLRGQAWFWFSQGNAQRGRQYYQEALQLEMPDTDIVRHLAADTYLFWSRAEATHGFPKEAERIRILAIDAAKRIGQTRLRDDMIAQIDGEFDNIVKKYLPNTQNI